MENLEYDVDQMIQQSEKDMCAANAVRALCVVLCCAVLCYVVCVCVCVCCELFCFLFYLFTNCIVNLRYNRSWPYTNHRPTLSRKRRGKSKQDIDVRRFVYRRFFGSR